MKPDLSEAADLLTYVHPFVASSGGGKYSFRILCSVPRCYRRDAISASRLTVRSEAHRKSACAKFAAQGWAVANGPVCPGCRKNGRA